MELNVRTAFVDFDLDATIDANALTDFKYVTKGGFALVFLANYRRSDGVVQPVAVKVLKPEHHFRRLNYSKFLQEVAFQTALPHPCIVQALGFCSVPSKKLIGVAPSDILTPSGGTGKKAKSAEWFKERRLNKCWALVMELMPGGNLFDQVSAAATATAAAAVPTAAKGRAAEPAPTAAAAMAGGLGSYSDAQALIWLIDLADAMTHLHSRQPLLIHRDLKPENVLLQRAPDGLLHAKLSDFGLMVAVDAAGEKVPPPNILRAPGQSIADVCAATPGRATTSTSQLEQPLKMKNLAGAGARGISPNGQPLGAAPPGPTYPTPRGGKSQGNLHVPMPVTPQMFSGWGGPVGQVQKHGDGQMVPGAGGPAAGLQQQQQANGPQQQLPQGLGVGQKKQQPQQEDFMLRPQRSAQSWTSPRQAPGSSHAGDTAPLVGLQASAQPSTPGGSKLLAQPPQQAFAAAVAAGAKGAGPGGADSAALPSSGLLPSPRSSMSRMSETGHNMANLDQLNGLMRMGKGHKDFLPDMYQMTFKLTSQCGSVCYMAPEVARQLPYNQKADVFSFGCIMFELVTRQLLSDGICEGDVDAALEYLGRVSWSGWRPELPPHLPKDIRLLISLSWHREPRLRPSFPTIAMRLREALYTVRKPSSPNLALQLEHKLHMYKQMKEQERLQQQCKQQLLLQQQLQQHMLSLKQQQQQHTLPQKQQQQQHTLLQKQQQQQHMQPQIPEAAWQDSQQQVVPVGVASKTGAVGAAQQQLQQLQLQQQQLRQRQQQQLQQQKQQLQQQQQQQQQHQQQLQLQLQQLNACTRASGGTNGCSSTASVTPCNSPSPFTAHGGASRLPSQVATTCTTAAHATGGRMSSPALGQHAQGRSAASLEAALATAGRSTCTTMMGTLNSEADFVPLPSPTSLTKNGAQRSPASKSEGSTCGVSAGSARSPPAEPNRLLRKEGCTSLCIVM